VVCQFESDVLAQSKRITYTQFESAQTCQRPKAWQRLNKKKEKEQRHRHYSFSFFIPFFLYRQGRRHSERSEESHPKPASLRSTPAT